MKIVPGRSAKEEVGGDQGGALMVVVHIKNLLPCKSGLNDPKGMGSYTLEVHLNAHRKAVYRSKTWRSIPLTNATPNQSQKQILPD